MKEPVDHGEEQRNNYEKAHGHHTCPDHPSERHKAPQQFRDQCPCLLFQLLQTVIVLHETFVLTLQSVQLLAIHGLHSGEVETPVLASGVPCLDRAILVADGSNVFLEVLALLCRGLPPPQPIKRHGGHTVGRVENPPDHADAGEARYGKGDRVEPAVLVVEEVPYPPGRLLLAFERRVKPLGVPWPEIKADAEQGEDEADEEHGGPHRVATIRPFQALVEISAALLAVEVRVGNQAKRKEEER
mmetsp:Transcript_54213/g.150825  ORF Transcript_54213/g.150825 Transcript_54213/m.150825 type:complete len:244 (-) Transcript_54213:411-1142(-)